VQTLELRERNVASAEQNALYATEPAMGVFDVAVLVIVHGLPEHPIQVLFGGGILWPVFAGDGTPSGSLVQHAGVQH
jgi:ABC-type microcin C transport system permease subunit YejB